jgi:acetylornithine deacetylase/succinyl-diaminopimelate desuccinylase-like protein
MSAPFPLQPPLRDEVVRLLQELIRLDTVSPPGGETRAAELLRDYLAESGVEAELVAKVPGRGSLVARLPGRGGPSLGFVSHTDTVVADPAEWSVDPWSGTLRDGHVWGRGALDMKGQVAASAVAIASLAREGFEPSGDLVFMATADEEVGQDLGLSWLCREHPDLVRVDYAINEGAGERITVGDRRLYLCAVAERRSSPFRLRVHGRSGHASMPAIADNALVSAAGLIERLASFRPEPRLIPEVEALFRLLTGEVPAAENALVRARELGRPVEETVEPLLGMTLAPTMIHASDWDNVIPGVCELTVDCRLLPGQSLAEAEETIRSALGRGRYELEWLDGYGGTRSTVATSLWDAVGGFIAAVEPEARVAPTCTAGFTDSHWLRQAFGTVAYGFFPQRAMDPDLSARLVHSADERIAVDDLELGLAFLRFAAQSLLRQ